MQTAHFSLNHGRRDTFSTLILSGNVEKHLARFQRKKTQVNGPEPAQTVLVHIHAYYPELLSNLLQAIHLNWPGTYPSMLITVPVDDNRQRLLACQQVFGNVFGMGGPSCQWIEVENRGRNLRPLLLVLHKLAERNETPSVLLHLHTKQTLDPEGIGNRWRRDLLNKLIGNQEQIRVALQLLAEPEVGAVIPCRFGGIERHYHWGGNFSVAEELVNKLFPKRSLHIDQALLFPAGLMFWCKPEALQPWLALALDPTHFSPEPLGTNGTIPHALERLFCHTVEAGGYTWRLLDLEADQPEARTPSPVVLENQPSVWQRHSDTYRELLNQQLREQRNQLQAEQQRSHDLALSLHQVQQQLRQHSLPWSRLPVRIALVLQRAGKGYISSAHLRLLEPLHMLEQQGRCQMQIVGAPALDQLAGSDVIIVQRGGLADPATADKLHQLCQQLKLPLIADIDDALCCLPADHAEQQRYQALAAATDRLLAHSDHAIFSTSQLAATYRSHLAASGIRLRRSSVVANGLSPRLWRPELQGLPPRAPLPPGQPVHILYMGSVTHDDDFAMLLPQLDALEDEQAGRFQLHLIGALTNPPERPWLKIRPVPLQARRYPDFVRWLLQRRSYHFGIAPLRANAFNAAKSDVKVLDYAALGLGSLCSVGPAYNHLIRCGLALGTSNDQWQQALRQLVRDPRPIQRCGRRAAQHLWRQRSCARVARELWQVLRVYR